MTSATLAFSPRTTFRTSRRTRRHGGYSLLEVSLVLAIAILLTGGVLLLLSGRI